MAREISAFKLRTEIAVDNAKASSALRATEKDVDKLGARFTKLGPEITKSMKGVEAGRGFGAAFSSGATAVITGSFDTLGQTLGSLIGTGIAPGIGTAIGSTVGSGIDKLAGTILGTVGPLIQQGIELNKVLESTTIEFTTFVGSEKEAKKYLAELVQLSGDIGILPTTLIETSEKLYDLTGNLKLTRDLLKASADQAADFGGSVATFQKIADLLGLIAEKGTITEREMKSLYKVGIKVPEILAEAFGKTPAQIKKLMAADRIDGEIAAGLIAGAIERDKAGYAALQAKTSTAGAERSFQARSVILAAEGTVNATRAYGDLLKAGNEIFSSERAHQVTKFFDETSGSLINMVERASRVGIDVATGVGKGILSGEAINALSGSISMFGDSTLSKFKSFFEIQSPSELMAREIGVPIGLGIAQGIARGFISFAPEIEKLIIENALKYGVPAELIRAVMAQESGGRVGAKSNKGARGLMQLMPGTAKRFGVDDPYNAAQSIRGGTEYLKLLIEKFNGNIDLVLAGYNAGEGAVQRHGNQIPPYAETQDYVRRIKGRLAGAGMAMPSSTPSAGGPLGDLKKVYDSLTPEQRQEMQQLGGTIKQTMDRIAAIDAEIRTAEGELKRARPGAGQPHGSQAEYKASFAVTRLNESRDVLVKSLQQQQLENQQLIQIAITSQREGAAQVAQETAAPRVLNPALPAARRLSSTLPDLTAQIVPLDVAMNQWAATTAVVTLGMPPLTAAQLKVGDASITLTGLLEKLQQQTGRVGIATEDMISKLAGALGQAAGMIPSQTVGKKRGLFSKILGIAAPFLAFVPGIGPILSAAAGIASNALGGNYSGAVSGIAGGLSPGGVFRGSGGSVPAGPTLAGVPINPYAGHRAWGGLGARGKVYWTGEHGPEPFLAPSNGAFLSHRDAMNAMGGGGGGNSVTAQLVASLERQSALLEQQSSLLERQNTFLARVEGIRPHDVVRLGARGMIQAYDQDAGLIRLSSQRHRLP